MRLMRHAKRARLSRALVFAALGLALGLALGNEGAMAQQPSVLDLSDPYVTVDLSVVEDGGVGPGASLAIPGFGRRLLMPGTQIPVSKLHVAAPKQRAGRVGRVSKEKKVARRRALAAPKAKTSPAPASPAMAKSPPPPPPMKAPAKRKVVMAPVAPPPPPPIKAAPEPKNAKAAAVKPEAPAKTAAPAPPPAPPATRAAKAPDKKPVARQQAKQEASLPPATGPLAPGQVMKVVFNAGATKLPASVRDGLKAVAAKMKRQNKLRMQLMAYAGGDGLSASRARRISLSRALAVRSYLIESGVRSTRIDVRALGNKTSAAPVNRVDVMVVER
jgi:outer membrane protein OmpA-like peptidoglycan-associated protein